MCRNHAQYLAFAPGTSEVAAGVWLFCILLFIVCPNGAFMFIFSSLQFLCILLLEETFAEVAALQ